MVESQRNSALVLGFLFVLDLSVLILGILCAGWPGKVQRFVIARLAPGGAVPGFGLSARLVRTNYYFWSLRVLGIIATICAAYVLFRMFRFG
jgi:hypothetical protein